MDLTADIADRFGYDSVPLSLIEQLQSIAKHQASDYLKSYREQLDQAVSGAGSVGMRPSERARWVANERWHPLQTGQLRKDASYLLRVPYTDDRELIMDILKYGADCEVLEPASLVNKALVHVEQMQRNYFGKTHG